MLKKGNNIQYFVFGLFIIVGLIFFILGIYIMLEQNISKDDRIYTTAIIERIDSYTASDGDTSHNVFISYYIDGELYEKKLNYYTSSYYEGKKIEIYYDKNNPNKVRTNDSNFGFLVFSALGFIVFLVGFVGIQKAIIKSKKNKNLKMNGREIYATYISTQLNTMYSVNGVNPYNIICEWTNPMDNKRYLFKSENIWFNPENYIVQNNIQTFKVYINHNNINQYVVDTSNIENNVIDLT